MVTLGDIIGILSLCLTAFDLGYTIGSSRHKN